MKEELEAWKGQIISDDQPNYIYQVLKNKLLMEELEAWKGQTISDDLLIHVQKKGSNWTQYRVNCHNKKSCSLYANNYLHRCLSFLTAVSHFMHYTTCSSSRRITTITISLRFHLVPSFHLYQSICVMLKRVYVIFVCVVLGFRWFLRLNYVDSSFLWCWSYFRNWVSVARWVRWRVKSL